MQKISVSLAAPAYNEEEGIEAVVAKWLQYLEEASFVEGYEVVICNDGSKDKTKEILDRLAARAPHFNPVHLEKNQGAAAALSKAIQKTQREWVLLLDSDGQFPVSYLEDMFRKTQSGAKAVIGVRQKKMDALFSRFGTAASAWLCNFFYGTRYKDFNSAFKLVDGNLLRQLTLEAKGLNYSTDVTAKLLERGIILAEVPIQTLPRLCGKSSMRALRDALHRLLFVFYLGYREFLFRKNVLQRPGA